MANKNTEIKIIPKQGKGLQRNTVDKYYTKKTVVTKCIELIKKNTNITGEDIVIEPSAGNGAFIGDIKDLANNYKFYDLEPENEEIVKQDFLNFDCKEIKEKYKAIHIIGNPQFGRQACTAIKFIKKCCEFANTIAFILPKSFKKDSMKQYFGENYHLVCEEDIEINAFLVNDKEYDVPCVFQIWKHLDKPRKKIIKVLAKGYKFVKKSDSPDISFRRVGVNAGNISKSIDDKSEQSHYFIKFTNGETVDKNIDKLKTIKFDFNNTVGPKSISKPELITEFNKKVEMLIS